MHLHFFAIWPNVQRDDSVEHKSNKQKLIKGLEGHNFKSREHWPNAWYFDESLTAGLSGMAELGFNERTWTAVECVLENCGWSRAVLVRMESEY